MHWHPQRTRHRTAYPSDVSSTSPILGKLNKLDKPVFMDRRNNPYAPGGSGYSTIRKWVRWNPMPPKPLSSTPRKQEGVKFQDAAVEEILPATQGYPHFLQGVARGTSQNVGACLENQKSKGGDDTDVPQSPY
jgi:hypothetical protein